MTMSAEDIVSDYSRPEWCDSLNNIPTKKVSLARLDTPIEKWNLPDIPTDITLSIKRDDLTGSTLSGNKIRKLEFLLGEAISKGCKHIITCGAIQSNHCRATAVASKRSKLQPHLVLKSDAKVKEDLPSEGNVLLNRLVGANIYVMPKTKTFDDDINPMMQKIQDDIRTNTGEEAYIFPTGGSDGVGVWGYIQCFDELLRQGALEQFDDIVCAVGSGGTIAGLAVGNYLNGSKVRCHGIIVNETAEYFYNYIDNFIDNLGLGAKSRDILNLIEGYLGDGYAMPSKTVNEFILKVARSTGIVLDPVYSGKSAWGMTEAFKSRPELFAGRRVLFIHTGGVFSIYNKEFQDFVKSDESIRDNITFC